MHYYVDLKFHKLLDDIMQSYLKSGLVTPSKLLLIFLRQVSGNAKKKTSVGEAVKRVNKENKCLYGNLLESRGKRRKSVASSLHKQGAEDDLVNPVISAGENEVHNLDTSMYPRSHIKTSRSNVAPDCDISVPQKGDTHQSVETSLDGFVKPLQRDTLAVVPSVVLKSIKGFPLVNQNKSVIPSYSLEPSVNSLSRSREYSKIYPSVGKILNATMSDVSKVLLKKWREKMISLLGEEGFLKFYKAQLNGGVQFHAAIQSFLRGASEEALVLDGQGVAGSWKSLTSVIAEIKDVQVIEGSVCHSHLFYHGVLDCIASYKGKEVLIEWKKSDKPKPTLDKTYDAPIQLSAYIGAMNYDQNYPVQVNGGLVVIAYSDGSPADVFPLNLSECNKYWKSWLERVHLFWLQQQESSKSTLKIGNKKL